MIDNRLYSLIKVAETGSFTKTAEYFSLTQPAVSQHIHSLEKELGVRIFERGSGRLVITREGEIAVKYAKRMIALENNLIREVHSEKLQLSSLTIGVTHTAESNQIAAALAKYANSRDNITLKIITESSSNLYDMLKNYEIDLAVVENKPTDPSFNYLPLDSDSLVLAVPLDHPHNNKPRITLNELKKERMILRLPGSSTRTMFEMMLEDHDESIDNFNVIMEINNIATIKDLVRHNFGVSVLARSTLVDEIKKHKIAVVPIENVSMTREINIVYRKDFEHQEILTGILKEYNELKQFYADAGN